MRHGAGSPGAAARRRPYRFAPALVLAAAALLWQAQPAAAHGYRLGAIQIGHLWAKPPEGDTLVVLGPLLNTGTSPDRLVGASSPAARAVGFVVRSGGEDRAADGLDLPPGRPVSLAPWAARIELEGLTEAPRAGATVPMTLTFEHAGRIDVEVVVQDKAGE
ncbi:MAG: copper chaperone PCu(A)C [Rhodospirillaceae bacterium]|nr:copper chaperone PCu(A)C [Rhodospirillaceae bacterium]